MILNGNEKTQEQIQDQTESVEGNETLKANIDKEDCEEIEEKRIKFIENLNKFTSTTDKLLRTEKGLQK